MFQIVSYEHIHELSYRSSGNRGPRRVPLPLAMARYRQAAGPTPCFLVTADLQGRETGRQNRLAGAMLADEIAALQYVKELPALDFVLLCGDFFDYPDLKKLGGTGDVTTAINALAQLAPQTYAVLGNHDEIDEVSLDSKVQILDGNRVKHSSGITIGGVGGIIGNPRKNMRKTDKDYHRCLQQAMGRSTDILLLHEGPQGALPKQLGNTQIGDWCAAHTDTLICCGHCHWPDAFSELGSNLLCNVDARAVIFIPSEE